MAKITHDGVEYTYSYTSDDLADFAGIAVQQPLDLAQYLKKAMSLIRHVEDNEANAKLRLDLGNAIVMAIQKVIHDVEETKNLDGPSQATN